MVVHVVNVDDCCTVGGKCCTNPDVYFFWFLISFLFHLFLNFFCFPIFLVFLLFSYLSCLSFVVTFLRCHRYYDTERRVRRTSGAALVLSRRELENAPAWVVEMVRKGRRL